MTKTDYYYYKFDKPHSSNETGHYLRLQKERLEAADKHFGGEFGLDIKGKGLFRFTTEQWYDGAKYSEQVYKYPDNPMKLVANYVKHEWKAKGNLDNG